MGGGGGGGGGGGRRSPLSPRRIRRVNRMPRERRICLYYVASPIRLLKPREMFRTIALTGFAALIAATAISLAPPARAQIGNIFSDPAPRPPGNVPRGAPPPDDAEEVPELPQGRLLPTPNRPLPGQGVPPP